MSDLWRPLKPSYLRRASWHDYFSAWIYFITMTTAPGAPALSSIGRTDNGVVAVPGELGARISKMLQNIGDEFNLPFDLWAHVIMPDHIHFLLRVQERIPKHLGSYLGTLKGKFSNMWWEQGGPDRQPLFTEGYHDRIIMYKGQVKTIKNYIADNPRRLFLKRAHPELFSSVYTLTPKTTESDLSSIQAIGNIFLLEDPEICAVRYSSHFSQPELEKRQRQWHRCVVNEGVLVGAFIHPQEKMVMDWALQNEGRVIMVCPQPFGERFKPKGRLFDLCAEGRLLLAAPQGVPNFSYQLTREDALRCNAIAEAIAAGDFRASR